MAIDDNQTWAGGSTTYSYGPGKLYWDCSAGFVPADFPGATGTGTDLGKTGPITIKMAIDKIEFMSIQTGARADDKAVSGAGVDIETTLKEASVNIWDKIVQITSVERDSADTPIKIYGSLPLAQRDRSIAKRMVFVEFTDGVERWDDPFKIIEFPICCPSTSEVTNAYDSENPRELAVTFTAYQSKTEVDHNGRPVYFYTREQL